MAFVQQDKVQIQVEVNGKQVKNTLADLNKAYRQLNREIRELEPGTEEFVRKAKDIAQVKKRIDDARDSVRSFQNQTKNAAGPKGMGLLNNAAMAAKAGLIGLAVAGVDALKQIGLGLFDRARELQGLQRNFEIVFGDSADFVDEAANRMANSLGLTVEGFKQAATAAGDLLIPMGFQREEAAVLSTNLVELSGALSEWTAGQKSSEEVSQILTKALLGEREELKQLGVSLSQAEVDARVAEKGLDSLTGTALQQAQALASLELITEKTSDAQNAFANGAATLAGRQGELTARLREFEDRLAQALIPVFERLLGIAEATLDIFDAFGGEAEEVDEDMRDLAEGFRVLISAWEGLVSLFSFGKDEISEIGEEVEETSYAVDFFVDAIKSMLGLGIVETIGQWSNAFRDLKATLTGGLTDEEIATLRASEAKVKESLARLESAQREQQAQDELEQRLSDQAAKEREEERQAEEAKQKKAEEKRLAQSQAAAEKLAAMLAKAEDELQTMRLEAMEEGLAKELARIDLGIDREIAAFEGSEQQKAEFLKLKELERQRLKDTLFAEDLARRQKETDAETAALQQREEKLQAEIIASAEARKRQRELEFTEQLEQQLASGVSIEEAQKNLQARLLESEIQFIQERIELAKLYGLSTTELEKQLTDLRIGILKQGQEEATQAQADYAQKVQEVAAQVQEFSAAGLQLAGTIFERIGQAQQAKLEARKEAELQAAGDNAEKRQQIEERFAREGEALRKKQARREKAIAIIQATIQTALSVAKALANPPGPPASIPQAIAAGALGAVQIATIAAQKFAQGGMIQGPSHRQGGVPFTVQGRPGFEAEGGEYITRRAATRRNLGALETINRYGDRTEFDLVPVRRFAAGGQVASPSRAVDSAVRGSASDSDVVTELRELRNAFGQTQFVTMISEEMADEIGQVQGELNGRRRRGL